MDQISAEIKKGEIRSVYLFYGQEAYKRKIYKDSLKKALFSNEMNYSYFEGESINWQSVYDICISVPFFAAKRLVIIENTRKFKAKPAGKSADDEILEILKALPETTCLAFFEEEAAKNKKIFKEIQKRGAVCECAPDNERTVAAWLKKGFTGSKKKISDATIYYLIERVGTDYEKLRSEFDKIIAYSADKEVIGREDIDAVTGQTTEAKVYELVNACVQKDSVLMLEKYYALLENDVYPLIILASLRSQFELLLQTAELCNMGLSDFEVSKKLGKAEFIIKNNKKILPEFRLAQLENIIDEIALTDKKIKDGDINEKTGVELLLIRISSR